MEGQYFLFGPKKPRLCPLDTFRCRSVYTQHLHVGTSLSIEFANNAFHMKLWRPNEDQLNGLCLQGARAPEPLGTNSQEHTTCALDVGGVRRNLRSDYEIAYTLSRFRPKGRMYTSSSVSHGSAFVFVYCINCQEPQLRQYESLT